MLLYNDSAVTLVRVRIRAELSGFALLPLKADCLACHQPHTWTAEADSCAVCHAEVVGQVPPELAEVKSDCSLCHEAHIWRINPDGFDCTVCHGEMASGLHSVEGHGDCSTCRGEHRWRPTERELCAVCHTDKEEHYTGMDCVDCHWEAGAEE